MRLLWLVLCDLSISLRLNAILRDQLKHVAKFLPF